MKPKILLATRNLKKCSEMRALLAPLGIDLTSVADFPSTPEVVEDGSTFQQNAEKKASQLASATGLWTIGEDSGLCVDALGGAPGVYSARFSGENATDEENNAKLIQELSDVPDERRTAKYVCHAALADPSGAIRINSEASCRGWITKTPRGTNGFGYDPYFLIREYHKTFGELSPLVKQHLSHRARAFARLIPGLVKAVQSNHRGPSRE